MLSFWGSALVTDEADFLLGPVVDRMNNMFRHKPRRVEDIADYNLKLRHNGLIIDKYAEQAIKHEKKSLATHELDVANFMKYIQVRTMDINVFFESKKQCAVVFRLSFHLIDRSPVNFS